RPSPTSIFPEFTDVYFGGVERPGTSQRAIWPESESGSIARVTKSRLRQRVQLRSTRSLDFGGPATPRIEEFSRSQRRRREGQRCRQQPAGRTAALLRIQAGGSFAQGGNLLPRRIHHYFTPVGGGLSVTCGAATSGNGKTGRGLCRNPGPALTSAPSL